jgi:hypothetical protein
MDPRPASVWDKAFSNFRVWRNPPISPYARVQLSENGLEHAPPSEPLFHLQTQMSINPSTSQSVSSRSNRPRSMWATVLSSFRLPPTLMQSDTPYAQVHHSDEEYAPTQNHLTHTPPSSRRPLHQQTVVSIPPPTTRNVSSSSHQTPPVLNRSQPNFGQGEHRPRPTRLVTLPLIQTISRTNLSRSSTVVQPSTTPRDDTAVSRVPQGVKSVPKAPGFRIEDTPTTTEGYPTWNRKRTPIRRDFFNPEIGASVSSLGTFKTFSTRRVEGEDSDSVLLITRPSVAPKTSDAGSIVRCLSQGLRSP